MTCAPRNEEIAGILRDEILRGQYRVGERLPSERDLAARFQTSRGTVREALKKLEQVGMACIQPGGARVAPLEQCTLEVLGPLLDVQEKADPELVDQVLEMFGVLLGVAAGAALRKAEDAELEQVIDTVRRIAAADADFEQQRQALRRLAELFIDLSDHLVLRLMTNGLRTQFMTRMLALGTPPPRPDPEQLRAVALELLPRLEARDARRVVEVMGRLNRLLRENARQVLAARRADDEEKPTV